VNKKAFSLVELMISITVLTVMLAIAVPYLTKYVKKYGIEKETGQIFSDLVAQRFKSITTGENYGVVFNANSYILFKFNDSNYNMKYDGSSEMTDSIIKNVKYKILKKIGSSYTDASNDVVIFDKNGVARNKNWGFGGFTIKIGSSDVASIRYNCVIISAQRIKESVCQ